MVPLTIIFLVTVNFFRYPERHYKGDKLHDVIAPSDGTIVCIEEVYEPGEIEIVLKNLASYEKKHNFAAKY